jgi:hypothetical protein
MYIVFLDWLLLLCTVFQGSVLNIVQHVSVLIHFDCQTAFHCVDRLHSVSLFFSWWAFMNHFAVNLCVQVFLRTFLFSSFRLIVWCFCVSLSEDLSGCFQCGYLTSHPHWMGMKVPGFQILANNSYCRSLSFQSYFISSHIFMGFLITCSYIYIIYLDYIYPTPIPSTAGPLLFSKWSPFYFHNY